MDWISSVISSFVIDLRDAVLLQRLLNGGKDIRLTALCKALIYGNLNSIRNVLFSIGLDDDALNVFPLPIVNGSEILLAGHK